MIAQSLNQRAERAKHILEDPVFQEAFAAVRQDALERFASSSPAESQVREAAYFEIQALENVEAALKNMIVDQRLSEHAKKG